MARRPVEPIFDTTPHPFGSGPAEPLVYDASLRALRQRTVNFAAKRNADMLFVTGLDHVTAATHFRPRAAMVPAGLDGRSDDTDISGDLNAAIEAGQIRIESDMKDQRVIVAWNDSSFGLPIVGSALTRLGYGSILLGEHAVPRFDPVSITRPHATGKPWPYGEDVGDPVDPPAAMAAALDAFMASSSGVYGVLIAKPDRVLLERYSDFGGPEKATPSWSMTKALTCTIVGRMILQGWLHSMHDPAPAPLWSDPRDIHRLITLDHLVRMRAGIGIPVRLEDGRVTLGFENSAVYQDGVDAFEAAQRSIVAALPGSVFRYVNAGMNVLGAVIQDQIMRRGLPYHQTVYGLLADKLGMTSFQHSADIAGNFIASGAGYATVRDYAKLGVLYLNDGVWHGERLLPEGWVDYALTATHTGTSYAACFRTNTDGLFPDLPADTAWAAGASDNKVFILRRAGLVVAVTNETDHKMDLGALNRLIATAIATWG
jgi:CubicO group peptidase (beta-lactamase class C family)